MTIGERIKEIRTEQRPKLSQAVFAEKTRVTRSMVAQYEINQSTPSDAYLQVVATTFGICFDWLRSGIEPKYQADQDDSAAALVPELVAVLDAHPALLRLVKKAAVNMTAADWKRLAELIEAIGNDERSEQHE